MKKITYVVEVTVELNKGVNPEDVHFQINLTDLTPHAHVKVGGGCLERQAVGKAISYKTEDYYED